MTFYIEVARHSTICDLNALNSVSWKNFIFCA